MEFPGETAEYRTARDALLVAEHELTRQIEAVAALRRALPLGGPVSEDYEFTADDPVRTVRLSELFDGHDTLLLYSFMYAQDMPRPCRMCTSVLDGLDGSTPDIHARASFAVVAKSPIERLRAYARERNWANLRLLSSTCSGHCGTSST